MKELARNTVRSVLTRVGGDCVRLLRLNNAASEFFAEDLKLAKALHVDAIVIPKATASSVKRISRVGLPMVALVETAEGILQSDQIARTTHVIALGLGSIDLSAELGLSARADGQELLYVRSLLVIASAAARIRPPIDTVYPNFNDQIGLRVQAQLARSLGMGGKFCVHPSQIQVVNRTFQPQPEELQAARRLLSDYDRATKGGRGATSTKGVMVDEAGFKRARRLLGRQPPEQP